MRKQFEKFAEFSKKIIFSDEAHFQLDGYVNTQNCRIWGAENPPLIHEKPLHAQRATVWCGFWAGGVIGPYVFENEAGNAVTVKGVRYRNWPPVPKIAGSRPTEAVGFFRLEKSTACLPSEGK